jgi:predicted RNA binding protein YcfA (HicA-like mRNA interferase family)
VHSSNPALRTTVPYATRDIKRRLLHAILKDCELSVNDVLDLL